MYAIINAGGKQYRVQQGDELRIEKIDAQVGETVSFNEVALVGGDELIVGTPFVEGFAVQAEVLAQGKADKVITFKYKAKKDQRCKNGHRQPFTLVKVTGMGECAAPAAKAEEKATVKASASMKKDELLAIANEMGIEVPAKATKADILAAIEAK